jgi:hypothetical protein
MTPLSTDSFPGNEQQLIDQMQEVRARNNVLWMDLLRLAFEAEPEKAKAIAAQIKQADAEIAELWERMGQ